jgi:hypothetical protein
VQGEDVDDPQDEDHEVEPVLHRACRSDLGEARDRLLRAHGVQPHERGHEGEEQEHEDAPEDPGETSPSEDAVDLLVAAHDVHLGLLRRRRAGHGRPARRRR